ncbi:XopX family type III secretion system effector [Hydrogenophaga taeniospiralis]|uniref:XopX family type III secretion system effector n=1 Tax=Hydrogenophaga taeniospiralis TaxID=65656 RepID=UPI000B1C5E55|nr:XopX family type III secretion system effector [Hydrogenophaga taeniospiralis]
MISSTPLPAVSTHPHPEGGAASSGTSEPSSPPAAVNTHPLHGRRADAAGGSPVSDSLPPRSAMPAVSAPSTGVTGITGSLWRAASGVTATVTGGLQTAQAATSSALQNLWSLSDLRTMLQPHADDPAFLLQLRGRDPEAPADYTFAQCRQQLQDLRALVQAGHGMEPRFQKTVLQDIQTIEKALNPLENGTSSAGRAAKALANMVNLWPVLVPSKLLANQAKTFAYTVAAASKAVVSVGGATLRPTADGMPFPLGGGELGRQADEVHFYPALLNAIFLSIEMSKKYGSPGVQHQALAVEHNKLAHAGFAVAAGTALIAPFVWNNIKSGANKVVEAGVRAAAHGLERVGFADRADGMRRAITPGEVGEAVKAELSGLWQQLETGRLALQQARLDFSDPASGRELTRTLNSQCTHLLESIALCTERLDKAFGISAAQEATGALVPRDPSSNPDFASKLALSIFATAITGSTIYLIQPDPIGTVDLAADSAVVTAVMLQGAFNKQATRQDAMERFKGMAATSMVMALALSMDKVSKTMTPRGLIEADSTAPYYAALVMTMMAMTMPGPIARGAELALNWGGRQIGQGMQQLRSLLNGPDGQQLGTMESRSLQELQQRMVELQSFHAQERPGDQQAALDRLVEESLRHTLADAGRQAGERAQPRTSGVVIQEIAEPSAHPA